jgi:hypothetical protein
MKKIIYSMIAIFVVGCSSPSEMARAPVTKYEGQFQGRSAELSCSYAISKNDNPVEVGQSISGFVRNEVRPELSNADEIFFIKIKQLCGGVEKKVDLRLSKKNYYILGVNGVNLPKHVVDYNNRLALDVDRSSFDKVVAETGDQNFAKFLTPDSAKTYAEKKELIFQQRALKMYAFVFAEAARFESIEHAVGKAIDGGCQVEWHDFDYTVHNWKNISTFVLDQKLLLKSQKRGGGNDQLLSPITEEQETAFDSALMSGKNYDYSAAAPFLSPPNYKCTAQKM